MSENSVKTDTENSGKTGENETQKPGRKGRGLNLKSSTSARRALAFLIREFNRNPGSMNAVNFKSTVYALSILLQFDEFAKNCQVEERIERLEKVLLTNHNEPK